MNCLSADPLGGSRRGLSHGATRRSGAEGQVTPLRVVVVGGGIAGLAAAHRLGELARAEGRALDLVLLEAADRLGGTIRTERVDGFLLEAGADSFISEKPWALALAERIGLGARLQRTDDPSPQISPSFGHTRILL